MEHVLLVVLMLRDLLFVVNLHSQQCMKCNNKAVQPEAYVLVLGVTCTARVIEHRQEHTSLFMLQHMRQAPQLQ